MAWTEELYRSAFAQHGSFLLRENGAWGRRLAFWLAWNITQLLR